MDYSIKIGGEAGQGIQTIGGTLAKLFARAGYHVFTHQDYESRIRGGHNFYQVRLADHPVMSSREQIDILVSLDKASITQHEQELTESGVILSDAATRTRMVDKRLFTKLPHIKEEIMPPFYYGSERPETVLVGWGSTYGVIRKAVDALMTEKKIAMLHFTEVYPFPETEQYDYLSVLKDAKISVCIENNATVQFARLVRAETGHEFHHVITKYDGRPFLLDELVRKINANITGL